HCYSADETCLHQIVDDWTKTHFQNMPAEAPDDWFVRRACIQHRTDQIAKNVAAQDMWKLGNEAKHILGTVHRLTEHARIDFAFALSNGIGGDTVKIQRVDGVLRVHA